MVACRLSGPFRDPISAVFFIFGVDLRRVHNTDMGGRLDRCRIHANRFSRPKTTVVDHPPLATYIRAHLQAHPVFAGTECNCRRYVQARYVFAASISGTSCICRRYLRHILYLQAPSVTSGQRVELQVTQCNIKNVAVTASFDCSTSGEGRGRPFGPM